MFFPSGSAVGGSVETLLWWFVPVFWSSMLLACCWSSPLSSNVTCHDSTVGVLSAITTSGGGGGVVAWGRVVQRAAVAVSRRIKLQSLLKEFIECILPPLSRPKWRCELVVPVCRWRGTRTEPEMRRKKNSRKLRKFSIVSSQGYSRQFFLVKRLILLFLSPL